MHFAISIPQHVPDGTFDPAKLRDYLTRAESLGFHSAWTQEMVLGSAPALAPLELMTFAAACTERLRLGCAVFVSPLHNPVHLAKSISTLDQLSRGRIEVGVATGGGGRMFSAFEVDPALLVARFTEGLRLMKACWTEPAITFAGLSGAQTLPEAVPAALDRWPSSGSGAPCAALRQWLLRCRQFDHSAVCPAGPRASCGAGRSTTGPLHLPDRQTRLYRHR